MTEAIWTRPPAALRVGAHRGLGAGLPENTLAAAAAAFHLGVDFVETDLRLTRDGVPVALHDADFARVAGDPSAIGDIDFETARRLKPDLATIAAMIDLAADGDRALLLDTKLADPTALARAAATLGGRLDSGRVAFGVRSLAAAETVLRLAPRAPLVGLLADFAECRALAGLGAPWARLWQHDAGRASIARLHDLGLAVLIMAGRPTSTEVGHIEADDLLALIADGADGVMLDDPAFALGLRDGPRSFAARKSP